MKSGSGLLSHLKIAAPVVVLPCPVLPRLTWFAGNGLKRQSQLGIRSDRQRLVTWGKGWDHDIRQVNLLKAKKPTVSLWGPKELPSWGLPRPQGGVGIHRA